MEFVQLIEFRTKKFDEINALEQEWRMATDGRRTLRQAYVTRDRNDPERYVLLAFFDSFESAQVNSNLPETSAFGTKQAALCDAPMAFTDLNVVDGFS